VLPKGTGDRRLVEELQMRPLRDDQIEEGRRKSRMMREDFAETGRPDEDLGRLGWGA